MVQHNVSDENPDPEGTARALAAARPDLIAVQELVPAARPAYERVLAARFPTARCTEPSACGPGIR